jgi:hypothetical protein
MPSSWQLEEEKEGWESLLSGMEAGRICGKDKVLSEELLAELSETRF